MSYRLQQKLGKIVNQTIKRINRIRHTNRNEPMADRMKHPVSTALPSLCNQLTIRNRVTPRFSYPLYPLMFRGKNTSPRFFPCVYNVLPDDSWCDFTQFTHFTQHIAYTGKKQGLPVILRWATDDGLGRVTLICPEVDGLCAASAWRGDDRIPSRCCRRPCGQGRPSARSSGRNVASGLPRRGRLRKKKTRASPR